jgi:hypothetical protein
MPQVLFASVIFQIEPRAFAQANLRQHSSYVCAPNIWDYHAQLVLRWSLTEILPRVDLKPKSFYLQLPPSLDYRHMPPYAAHMSGFCLCAAHTLHLCHHSTVYHFSGQVFSAKAVYTSLILIISEN